MERDVLAFCRRQSAKMIEYAEDCADPGLKEQFLQMSDYWQSLIPAPSPQAKLVSRCRRRRQHQRHHCNVSNTRATCFTRTWRALALIGLGPSHRRIIGLVDGCGASRSPGSR